MRNPNLSSRVNLPIRSALCAILLFAPGSANAQLDDDPGRFMPADFIEAHPQPAQRPDTPASDAPARPLTTPQLKDSQTAIEHRVTRGGHFAELVKLMSGSFSSADQAVNDPDFLDIRLRIVQIWRDRDERGESQVAWFYVEQAAASSLDKPYRQRIYKLTGLEMESTDPKDKAGTKVHVFRSDVFLLPGDGPDDALRFAGCWKTPEKFNEIKPSNLKLRDGCAVILTRNAKGEFTGGTVGDKCPSDRAGAKYATSEVHIDAGGMKTWDRGFDQAGKQVWGATKGAYEFKRVKE